MKKKEWLEIFLNEQYEAVRSLDVDTFRQHYEKWRARGFYELKLPRYGIIEISLRKMLYNMAKSTEEEKAAAKEWLQERGFTTEI